MLFQALVDTECTAYSLIHTHLILLVCDSLSLKLLPLFKPKWVHSFDRKVSS